MNLSASEQEVVIAKCRDETEWTVYCTDSSALSYYLRLAKEVGGRVVESQGGKKIFYPEASVLLQKRRKSGMTPAQREAQAERMRQVRQMRKTSDQLQ